MVDICSGHPTTVEDFLVSKGLGQYADAFLEYGTIRVFGPSIVETNSYTDSEKEESDVPHGTCSRAHINLMYISH